jgi:hypothetical protein
MLFCRDRIPSWKRVSFKARSLNCVCLSVRMEQLDSHQTVFYEIWNFRFFLKNLLRKIKFCSNLTGITGTLHEDRYTFTIISRSFLLRMRNVSDKICRENQNTHFVFNGYFISRKSCRFLNNMGKYGRDRQARYGIIIRRMRFACWITKATDTHLEYVTFTAFPQQQWLRERSTFILYLHCLCWNKSPGHTILTSRRFT